MVIAAIDGVDELNNKSNTAMDGTHLVTLFHHTIRLFIDCEIMNIARRMIRSVIELASSFTCKLDAVIERSDGNVAEFEAGSIAGSSIGRMLK